MKKNTILSFKQAAHVKGFTLIEFMVASGLAMIVLLAVGVTYATTNRTKRASESRLAMQQDLRNTAEMISRDARMAGSFGCFNMGATTDHNIADYASADNTVILNTTVKNGVHNTGLGFNTLEGAQAATAFNRAGFATNGGGALVFTYGLNPISVDVNNRTIPANSPAALWAQAGGAVALSSCLNMAITGVTVNNSGKVEPDASFNNNVNSKSVIFTPQAMVSQVYAVAYVIGTVNNVGNTTGLYRFTRTAVGGWEGPQLMVANINYVTAERIYAACPANGTEPRFSSDADALITGTDRGSRLPTLIEVRLGTNENENTYGRLNEYLIRANVRGGSECRNVKNN